MRDACLPLRSRPTVSAADAAAVSAAAVSPAAFVAARSAVSH